VFNADVGAKVGNGFKAGVLVKVPAVRLGGACFGFDALDALFEGFRFQRSEDGAGYS
jgi:hypothetical protein